MPSATATPTPTASPTVGYFKTGSPTTVAIDGPSGERLTNSDTNCDCDCYGHIHANGDSHRHSDGNRHSEGYGYKHASSYTAPTTTVTPRHDAYAEISAHAQAACHSAAAAVTGNEHGVERVVLNALAKSVRLRLPDVCAFGA